MAHTVERLVLLIGEPQPLRQPASIFGDGDAQRAEPQHPVGRQGQLGLDGDHLPQRAGIADAAGDARHQPGIVHRHHSRQRAGRDKKLDEFAADALGGEAGHAIAAADAGEQSGAVRCAVAVSRVNAEEAQDAQIILGDAAIGITDEAHAPRIDNGKAADMIMHDAVDGRR